MTLSKCATTLALITILLSTASLAAADPPLTGNLTYSLSHEGTTLYEELSWLPVDGSSDTWVQLASRPELSEGPSSLSWWLMNGPAVRRYLVQRLSETGEQIVEELPAWIGAESLPARFTESAVSSADPTADQESITVPAGTYQTTHGVVARLEVWVSDQVPVRGLVKAVPADGVGATIELYATSPTPTSLLPDPLPPLRFAPLQRDQLPLGAR